MAFKPRNQPHRGEQKKTPYHISLRIHRALSWLHRAKTCESDLDGRFIFLWCPFNAPHLREKGQGNGQERVQERVQKRGYGRV
jgi:hypothetical protein